MVILKVLAIILSHFQLDCGPDSVFLVIISPIYIGLKRYFSQIIPRPFKISLFHYHIDCGPVSIKIGITFQILIGFTPEIHWLFPAQYTIDYLLDLVSIASFELTFKSLVDF